MSSVMRPPVGGFFYIIQRGVTMNLYIYSDESGVFDKQHNDIFVFGGLILLNNEEREIWSRKYSSVEKILQLNNPSRKHIELKGSHLTNKEKGKLFRSLNQCYKFAGIVKQKELLERIFDTKKDKQRYLDYAYKLSVKRALSQMIKEQRINANQVERMYFFVDEHTTATNGCYELKEALEQEFRFGTYNYNYSAFFPPIFHQLQEVNVTYCNSRSKLLIRAADIVANRVYYLSKEKEFDKIHSINQLYATYFP